MKKKFLKNTFVSLAVGMSLLMPAMSVTAAQYEFRQGSDGKQYWYDGGR